ncbi:MAG: hypothetical protein AMDU5_GPLC00015G0006 [Thermoplasmatales archaeon Gpl]|nr:MAG: hypothetical protein AMDU5_GPLC00015G0006 [Thermoplasmatales archaeon Gpl]
MVQRDGVPNDCLPETDNSLGATDGCRGSNGDGIQQHFVA